MEIKDYLKVLGKRAWLLVMIPAVAGVVAGLIAVQQPQAFRTTATLQLPHDENASPAEVAQLVADFRAAADNATVQNQLAEDTGVPVKRIKRLKITQVGDSSQLTLSFQDKKRSAADSKAVIEGLTIGALKYLEAPELRNGQRDLDAANAKIEQAQEDLTSANNDLNALYAAVQSSQPEEDLKTVKSDKSQFTQGLARELAAGNTAGAQSYREFITQADVRIVALGDAVPKVQALKAQAASAQAVLDAAVQERDAATDQLNSATTQPDITFSAEGQAVVRKTRVVKTAAAAVVAGFPIAVGVVLLLDALQKRRQNRPARPTADEDFDADVAPEDVEPAPARVAPTLIGASVGAAAAPVVAQELDDDVDDVDDVDDDVDDGVDTAVYAFADREVEPDDVDDELVVEDDELVVEDDDDLTVEADDDLLVAAEDVTVEPTPLIDGAPGVDVEGEQDDLDDLDDLDELDDLDDLDDEDLEDDLDDELDEDVEATVASRRRMYDADIDDDLSVDGGHADRNGQSRVWARVPATDEDFDDDEGASTDR